MEHLWDKFVLITHYIIAPVISRSLSSLSLFKKKKRDVNKTKKTQKQKNAACYAAEKPDSSVSPVETGLH